MQTIVAVARDRPALTGTPGAAEHCADFMQFHALLEQGGAGPWAAMAERKFANASAVVFAWSIA
jgi:hypothetical protein